MSACPYCGGDLADHSPAERAHCERQARLMADPDVKVGHP